MTEGTEERTTTKIDQWRERLAEHARSGLTVKRFCEERGITQYSFYAWRKRLRDRVKILYWDRDGFALWSKRLEEGTYAMPFGDGGAEHRREITAQELAALLSGIDLQQATRGKRYQRSV